MQSGHPLVCGAFDGLLRGIPPHLQSGFADGSGSRKVREKAGEAEWCQLGDWISFVDTMDRGAGPTCCG